MNDNKNIKNYEFSLKIFFSKDLKFCKIKKNSKTLIFIVR